MTEQGHHSSPDLERLLSALPPGEADSLRRAWNRAAESAPGVDEARAEAVWRVLSAATSSDSQVQRIRVASRETRVRLVSWQRAAAAAAILIFVTAALLLLLPHRVNYSADVGETMFVTLSDGSSAALNSGTTLRYRDRIWSPRSVTLDGEAYFDVAAGRRPFVVATFNVQVRVVGTQFNVRARRYDDEPSTVVSVDEGQVDISAQGSAAARTRLSRGQSARIDAQRVRVLDDQVGSDDSGAWRNGDLIFKDESLGVVLDEVARRFDVRLQTGAPELRSIRLSLAVREASDVEIVLGAACVALNLRYRPVSGGFEIYSPEGS